MNEARKIAAILAADVVGYSRLTGADEDKTLARLRALRSDLIDPTFAIHHGRIVKRMGDGVLAEFRSVVDAVKCAVEIQTSMLERNVGLTQEHRIDFRIGIHLGDVVEESDGDLMGDGVNIAARLEGVAKVGGICLSEDAYRQVRSRLDLAVEDMGPTRLKNIAEPIRTYALDVAPASKPAPAPQPAAAPAQAPPRRRLGALLAGLALLVIAAAAGFFYVKYARTGDSASSALGAPSPVAHLSIVVLPFNNLSRDPDEDYLADGITENLTTDLTRIRNSFVIARNTAFTYKGKATDAREIGRELGVRYVLEGSVQRDQNRVRVNAQLIDAETGAHLWADRYEQDVANLFKLQDQVVARLVNSLGYELVKAEAAKGGRAKNPDVVDLTMRGWALTWRMTQSPLEATSVAALSLFDSALALDPNDAGALSGEASVYLAMYLYGWGDSRLDFDGKILGLADRAIAAAPDDSRAFLVKSEYLTFSRRAVDGLAVAEAGLSIAPNDAHLSAARGFAEIGLGRLDLAEQDFESALRSSPRDPAAAQWRVSLGLAKLGLGRYEAAVEEFQNSISFGNRTFIPYAYIASAYALADKKDQAAAALADARALNPRLTVEQVLVSAPAVPHLAEGLARAGLGAK